MSILIAAAFVLMIAGFFMYNSVRKAWAPIIGVGGAYIIAVGIMLGVALIGSLFGAVFGGGSAAGQDVSAVGVIIIVIFAVVCLGYMVMVMLSRCQTVKERILLPFVCLVLCFGFCWRFMAAIFLHIPMESGQEEDLDTNTTFPQYIYDGNGDRWVCQVQNLGKYTDNAEYENEKTGQTVHFWASDFDGGTPSGFHR